MHVPPSDPYDETPVAAFLPSVDDIEAIKHDYTILASRVAFEFIPYFKSFEDIVPNDISKPCDPKFERRNQLLFLCQFCLKMNSTHKMLLR